MNLLDILTISLYQFYRKCVRAAIENLNFDLGIQRLSFSFNLFSLFLGFLVVLWTSRSFRYITVTSLSDLSVIQGCTSASCTLLRHGFKGNYNAGFVQVMENLESHGIL